MITTRSGARSNTRSARCDNGKRTVFDIVRRLRTGSQMKNGGVERPAADITLLAVTQDADGWRDLRDIADRSGWLLLWARSCETAVELIQRSAISLVICDRDLAGEDWRAIIRRIASLKPAVCVLLASPVCDEYLWKEVAQHGGFDVVAKPFDPDRVKRAVKLASSWRGWAHDRTPGSSVGPEPRP